MRGPCGRRAPLLAIFASTSVALLAGAASAQVTAKETPIVGSDTKAYDFFGAHAVLDGATAVVGAWNNNAKGISSGAAYVFPQGSSGGWSQSQKLVASDGAAGDNFGRALALHGDNLAIAAPSHMVGGTVTGAVYVFSRTGTTWAEKQLLGPQGGGNLDYFGSSVTLSADTLAVGSRSNDGAPNDDRGAAYVYTRTGSTWGLQQKLVPADATQSGWFGYAVALDQQTLLVGAPQDDDKGTFSGSVYVYLRSGSTWGLQQKLTASDGAAGDNFGAWVALEGDVAAIGAYKDDNVGVDAGSAYIFVRTGTIWAEKQKLVPTDAAAGGEFGRGIALSGSKLVVGRPKDNAAGATAGSAYLFLSDGTKWTQAHKLQASNAAAGDLFGAAVGLSGSWAVVGGYLKNSSAGAAYIYQIQLDKGAPCTAADQCTSGYCVDSVCCTSTCGAGLSTDCQACSVAAGGAQNGTCGPVKDGTACSAAGTCKAGSCIASVADGSVGLEGSTRDAAPAVDRASTADGHGPAADRADHGAAGGDHAAAGQGCGCSLQPPAGPAAPWLALALLLLLVLRRRSRC